MSCDYCKSSVLQGEMKCANCGAPVNVSSDLPDFRSCPICHRKLLALGSPACNYCGRRLPDEYIRAREADLRRITDGVESASEPMGEISQFFSSIRHRKRNESSSIPATVDLTTLIDFFS
jgi:hypothetical protein